MKHFLFVVATVGVTLTWGGARSQEESIKTQVDLRVRAWQPTSAERRVDEIAWAPDLCAALRQGQESGRPIFVFTHDGRLGVGRQ